MLKVPDCSENDDGLMLGKSILFYDFLFIYYTSVSVSVYYLSIIVVL